MQGEIVALVHSHPGGLPWLSEGRPAAADKECPALVAGLPGGKFTNSAVVPHLTGRRFEHGVTDCYTLFRDAYHLAGITLPIFVREDDWWRNGQNLLPGTIWRRLVFYRVPLFLCTGGRYPAVLLWRIGGPIMPPYTAATVNCFTICLNN